MKEDKIMTPEEARTKVMEYLEYWNHDSVYCHIDTDTFMEDLLISLGYGEAVELIRGTEMWYS